MDQMKRKFSCHRLSKKKLRSDLIGIENLSDELFYEIFDYLDGNETYHAFSNLNHRFEQLLNSPSLLLKIELHYSKSHQSHSNNYEQFLLLNKSKILSIKLWFEFGKNHFFSFVTNDSSLNRLESLFIQPNQSDLLLSLLMNLSSLPRLFVLTIRPWYHPDNLHDIYRLIFLSPRLKSFRFLLDILIDPIRLTMATNQPLSPIEYLSIDHSCTFHALFTILSYTPELRRLTLSNSIDVDRSIETLLPITLTNLTKISIRMDHVTFEAFERIIRKINAKFKVLRVSTRSQHLTFLNAHRWEQLISQSFSQLEEFYLRYYERVCSKCRYSIHSEKFNQFTSSFWIERQWTFEAEIIDKSINYFIGPYKKRWYEDSSIEYSESTRLTIIYIYHYKLLEMMTTRVLTKTPIYHLEIAQENVHTSLLIRAVNLLPDLQTLKIHSFSLYEPRMLKSKELMTLSSLIDTSQITNVYLQKMNDIAQFDFLLKLCPYMEYLRVDDMKHLNFKFVLRCILKKIQDHDHLRLLCFRVSTADDQMIRNLKRMIHFEKLLSNYTIKRVTDQIYFAWK